MDGRSINLGQADARYKYIAKELDIETGYGWFDRRMYDSRIGLFRSVDLLAETASLRAWSPYHYAFDNPVRFIDPSGLQGEDSNDEEKKNQQQTQQTSNTQQASTLVLQGAMVLSVPYVGPVLFVLSMGAAFPGDAPILQSENAQEPAQNQEQTGSESETTKNESGAKSLEEYNKHQEKLQQGKDNLKQLEDKLSETKGPKREAPLKEEIQKLNKSIKGHEKEIRQKWPDGPPSQ